MELRPYQKEAIQKTLTYFQKKRDPAVIVLPTGAGKSLVIAELAKIARGRVLILAHVKELVEQNHEKFLHFKQNAGLYSHGLGKKDAEEKVIFGSVQSVANASLDFFHNFSLLIIDECHRVDEDGGTQYQEIISKLKINNKNLCILGLTATPYRLGRGWIFEYAANGEIKSNDKRFFHRCVFDLPLSYMIKNQYLTPPIKIDIPVTCYNFKELTDKEFSENQQFYSEKDVDELLKKEKRLTPLIIKNIISITEQFQRSGVMIFSATVKHAIEILSYLPGDNARLILGDTPAEERDEVIKDFKAKKFTYLVNVSVLTTGFDAPHVDVIAILRPTESNALYQQIVGRGLRLSHGKKDCIILDYTGIGHDIFRPDIHEKKPQESTVLVEVICPLCQHLNHFWGYQDDHGNTLEHFGRSCKGSQLNHETLDFVRCTYLFRSKLCPQCQTANDVTARLCRNCQNTLSDADAKLKQAKLSKFFHVMTPVHMQFQKKSDKRGEPYVEIGYFDSEGQSLKEIFYFQSPHSYKKFEINFLRMHLKKPEVQTPTFTIEHFLNSYHLFRSPKFIIARKQEQFWKITEKIFAEEVPLSKNY